MDMVFQGGRSLAVAALAGCLILVGCSDQQPDRRTTPSPVGETTRGIDAKAYYDDYRNDSAADQSGASALSAQPGSVPLKGAVPQPAPRLPHVPVVPPTPPQPPEPWEDDTFVDAGTSGFVEVSRDSRSTFALDVDTGSWNVARTLLRGGTLPPPASIRAEEWINALPTDQAAPTEALGIRADSALAPSLSDGTQLVRVGVATRPLTEADRKPVNVTLVVDRSGSMDIRERLGLVKASLALLADSLRDDDKVSVVTFESSARPLLAPTPVRDTDAILAAIDKLTPAGSTNLAAGLRLGYKQARSAYDEDATNIVLLASDGVANVGATDVDSLVGLIGSKGRQGIHLVTVGYGMGNYNDHLMEQLADLGDGFYAYVDDYAEAERLFRDRLTTALVPVADDARAQVEFDPDAVTSYRLIGYDNRAIDDDDFTDPAVDAGELGAGHHATALYEVRLADGVEAGTPIGRAGVRWTPVGGGAQQQAETTVVAADAVQPEGALALQAVVADFAQLLKHAKPVADRTLTLADLHQRAIALTEDDVPGAAQVAETIRLAQKARPAPPDDLLPIEPPIR
jgi:Ca-activated chloride channel family protein